MSKTVYNGFRPTTMTKDKNQQQKYIQHCAQRLRQVIFSVLHGKTIDIFSLGERCFLEKCSSLGDKHWEVYALLQRRVPQRKSHFMVEFKDYEREIIDLLEWNIIQEEKHNTLCVNNLSKKEAKELLAAHDLSHKGRINDLRNILYPIMDKLDLPTLIQLANPELIKRCIAIITQKHSGNWEYDIQLFVQNKKSIPYRCTVEYPLFTRRVDFWNYYYSKFYPENSDVDNLLQTLPPEDYQYRFSSHRQAILHHRLNNHTNAMEIYGYMLKHRTQQNKELLLSYFDYLIQHKDHKKIKQYVKEIEEIDFENFEVEIRRKLKLLFKSKNLHLFPRYAFHTAKERYLYLPRVASQDQRILFQIDQESYNVEASVVTFLQKHNRSAMFTENHAWKSLLKWLFYDCIFAPIDGMLPYPNLKKPLDYHSDEQFFTRRKKLFKQRFEDLRNGKAQEIMQSIETQFFEHLSQKEEACYILNSIEASQLIPLLELMLRRPNSLKGLPDILVSWTNNRETRIGDTKLVPTKIPSKSFFIEVKCHDSVSSEQKYWHHKLQELGFVVEIWNLREMN